MYAEEFIKLLRTRPFVPLRLHLTNGETFDVRHPELAIVGRSIIDLGLDPDPKTGVVGGTAHLGLSHIVRVERLEATANPSKSNGDEG